MRPALFALSLMLALPAQAADCIGARDPDWFSLNRFFAETPFGTVGYTRDDGAHIFVPKAGTPCIAMRAGRPLRFIFNHRGPQHETGYVSFKLYGYDGPYNVWTRLLQRSGSWQRGAKDMQDPWKKLDAVRPTPALLSDYEAFSKDDVTATEAVFDSRFGMMHGMPKGSNLDSWNDRTAMQPEAGVDLPKLHYVAHSLQRVETGPAIAGNPPDYSTVRFEYRSLVLHVFSPLGDGPSSTIVFNFTN